MTTMRALQLQQFGPGGLREVRLPMPEPGPGEVLVRLQAVALNHRDLEIVSGRYAMPVSLPLIPVSDAVGEVVALGQGATAFAVGERVSPLFFPDWQDGAFEPRFFAGQLGAGRDGMYREYVALPERELVRVPRHLGAAAACLPIAALTAWRVLDEAGLRPGQRVLVQGLGGVSLLVLQLAPLFGLQTLVVAADATRAARAAALGADLCIDRGRHSDWGEQALVLTGGRGADLVVEVGGRASFAQSARALAVNGSIAMVGYLGGAEIALDIKSLFIAKRARLLGHTVGSRRDFEALNRALEAHRVEPVIAREFGWSEHGEAFALLAEGKLVGKLLIHF